MSAEMFAADTILPFQIEGQHISGRVVRLSHLTNEILGRHNYAQAVERLLAESLVLTSMLGSTLKFDGRFIVQLQGGTRDKALETPAISTLIAEYNNSESQSGTMRGCAQYDEAILHESLKRDTRVSSRLETLFGDRGYMGLTVDQGAHMSNYQGIVSLTGDTLTQAALDYFARSVQIATALFVVARPSTADDGVRHWQTAGILLQKMPHEGGETAEQLTDPDAWDRMGALLHTLQSDELLDTDLSLSDLLWRLFHEEGVRVYEPRAVSFSCPCSRGRVYDMLMRFPADEKEGIQSDPETEVRCEFCNKLYTFTADELAETTDSVALDV